MLRELRVYWRILSNVGSVMRLGRQADKLFRYYALKVFEEAGLFEYLKEPRTYAQILTEFGFADIDYTREWLEILSTDKENMLIDEDRVYRRNPEVQMPNIDALVNRTSGTVVGFTNMAEGMVVNILPRMRQEPVVLAESFEKDGRQLLLKMDATLGQRLYSSMRLAVFDFLTAEDLRWLQSGTLLEVGCGSGRETAEIWTRLGGKTRITGIDPVPGIIGLAEQAFEPMVKELDPNHPPITDANRPVFKEASATRLPFPDNSFDSVMSFWMLHWTPDPRQAISEMVRVCKPGGLVFGAQAFKPEANPYFDLVFRTNESCHGMFWREDFRRWFKEQGIEVELATPVGTYRGRKP